MKEHGSIFFGRMLYACVCVCVCVCVCSCVLFSKKKCDDCSVRDAGGAISDKGGRKIIGGKAYRPVDISPAAPVCGGW